MKHGVLPYVGVVLVATLIPGGARAQHMYTLVSPNEENGGTFGVAVAGGGDVNNDGYDDLVVSGKNEDPGTSPDNAGRVYVFSGATGDTLYTLISPNEDTGGLFGQSVALIRDVDNDGCDDVVVGAFRENPGTSPTDAGAAYIFSGATGAPLDTLLSPNAEYQGQFGVSVSNAGDVNDDGYDDVVVGAYTEDPGASPTNAGRAYTFSGHTGGVLDTLVSPNEENGGNFGARVRGAGDVDNDGYDDVIVGAYLEDPGASPADCGRAYVFSGQTGAVLHTLASPNEEADGRFGFWVSGAGDANNDGHDDVVVGAYTEDPGTSPASCGRAYVFSGATGDTLWTLVSPNETANGALGIAVSDAGDVNGDGCDDVIVGAYLEGPGSSPSGAGRAYVFSGATGGVVYTLVSPNEEEAGAFSGFAVAGAGDVNKDGLPDVVVGAYQEDPGTSPDNAGRAYVYTPAMPLTGSLLAGNLLLQWASCVGVNAYWVHGADNQACFVPTVGNRLAVLSPGTTVWGSSNGVGNPDHNWTYLILAVDEADKEMCRSNRFGEHDFSTAAGP